ncbi:MAG: YceI family protein [Bacteroidota bacterium]
MSKWIFDPNHTEVGFKVKHLVISTVSGKFGSFEGSVEAKKKDFSDAKISFSVAINSVYTGQEQRDAHLKSADFFNAEKYPQLLFVSSQLVPLKGNEYKLKGDLTIHGVTKPTELNVEFGGIQDDLYGQTIAGFEIEGKIKRSDFGLNWNAVTESGGLVVGDDVKIQVNAELIKKD